MSSFLYGRYLADPDEFDGFVDQEFDDELFNRTQSPSAEIDDGVGSKGSDRGIGASIFWILLIVVGGCLCWRLWSIYRVKTERQMQEYRIAQADRVLGDMQMVPNADLDNENELI
jgi:hypothetical protein